ncbi:MAG: hypothetical protein Aurels2KO_53880 [Aureliella sp.]
MTAKERQKIVRIHYAVAHVVLPKGKGFFMPLVRVADEKWVDLKDFSEFTSITDEDVFTSYHAYFDSSGFVPMGVHTNFLLSDSREGCNDRQDGARNCPTAPK